MPRRASSLSPARERVNCRTPPSGSTRRTRDPATGSVPVASAAGPVTSSRSESAVLVRPVPGAAPSTSSRRVLRALRSCTYPCGSTWTRRSLRSSSSGTGPPRIPAPEWRASIRRWMSPMWALWKNERSKLFRSRPVSNSIRVARRAREAAARSVVPSSPCSSASGSRVCSLNRPAARSCSAIWSCSTSPSSGASFPAATSSPSALSPSARGGSFLALPSASGERASAPF